MPKSQHQPQYLTQGNIFKKRARSSPHIEYPSKRVQPREYSHGVAFYEPDFVGSSRQIQHAPEAPVAMHRAMDVGLPLQKKKTYNNPHKIAYATSPEPVEIMTRRQDHYHDWLMARMEQSQSQLPVIYDLTTPTPPRRTQERALPYRRVRDQRTSRAQDPSQQQLPSYKQAWTHAPQNYLSGQQRSQFDFSQSLGYRGHSHDFEGRRVANLRPAIWSNDAGTSHENTRSFQRQPPEYQAFPKKPKHRNHSHKTPGVLLSPGYSHIMPVEQAQPPAVRSLAPVSYRFAVKHQPTSAGFRQEQHNEESPTLEEILQMNKPRHSTTRPFNLGQGVNRHRTNADTNTQENRGNHPPNSKNPSVMDWLGKVVIDLTSSPTPESPTISVPMKHRIPAPQKSISTTKIRASKSKLASKDIIALAEYRRQRLAAESIMKREQLGGEQVRDIELFGEVIGNSEVKRRKTLDKARLGTQKTRVREEEAFRAEELKLLRLLEDKRRASEVQEAIQMEKEVADEDKRRKRQVRNQKIAAAEAAKTEMLRQKAADAIKSKRIQEAISAADRETKRQGRVSVTQVERDGLARLTAKLEASKQQALSLPSLDPNKSSDTAKVHSIGTEETNIAIESPLLIENENFTGHILLNDSGAQVPANMTEIFARATAGKSQSNDDDREEERQLRLRKAFDQARKSEKCQEISKSVTNEEVETLSKGENVLKAALASLKEQRESSRKEEKEAFLRSKRTDITSKTRQRSRYGREESSKRWVSSRVNSRESHEGHSNRRARRGRHISQFDSDSSSTTRSRSRSQSRGIYVQKNGNESSRISVSSLESPEKRPNEISMDVMSVNEQPSSSTGPILNRDTSQSIVCPPKVISQVEYLADVQRAQVEANIKARAAEKTKQKNVERAKAAAERKAKNNEARRRKRAEEARLKFEIEVRGHASKDKNNLTEEEIKQKVDSLMQDRERKLQTRSNTAAKSQAKRPSKATLKDSSQATITGFSSGQQNQIEPSISQQASQEINHEKPTMDAGSAPQTRKELEDLTIESLRALRGLRPASRPQKMEALSDTGESNDESGNEEPITSTAHKSTEIDYTQKIIEHPVSSVVAPHVSDPCIRAIRVPPGDASSSSVKIYKVVKITNVPDQDSIEAVIKTLFERAEANSLAISEFQNLSAVKNETSTITETSDGQYFHGIINYGDDESITVTVKPDFVPQDKLHNFDVSMLKPLFSAKPYLVFQSITKQVMTTENREMPSSKNPNEKYKIEVQCEKITQKATAKWLFTDREIANKKACDHTLELMRPRRARIDDPDVITYQSAIAPPIRNQYNSLGDSLLDLEIEFERSDCPWLDFVGLHVWVEELPMYGPIN
ncbi:hypothetical protein BP5796_10215 [Coleophoma crateriformis]|uniref:Uncharacterized protein n=1 Tax=Coleophoma crateriformis TaxID=565419 RepID=A0A3D8QUJ8_9HELO|nr:hypothetical protein BP5796_10215 [Coleophoma crateriformis]